MEGNRGRAGGCWGAALAPMTRLASLFSLPGPRETDSSPHPMEHNRSGLWGRGSSFKGLEESVVLPVFSAAAQVRVGLTLLLCVISATCNVAMLWTGWTRPAAKGSHARLLLLHLAVADLLVALVVMPLDAAWNITLQWQAGDVACRLLMFLKLLAMYASAFVTTLISLDCQAAILQPLATARAWRKNQILLYAAWLMSASLSTPQVLDPAHPGKEAPPPWARDPWLEGALEGARGACTSGSAPKPFSLSPPPNSCIVPAVVPVPHSHHQLPPELHPVHDLRLLCPALARGGLQHVQLPGPFPAPSAGHERLLHPGAAGDFKTRQLLQQL